MSSKIENDQSESENACACGVNPVCECPSVTPDQERLLVAATIAHLLEHLDDGSPVDREAAKSTLRQSGLAQWVKENAVMLPLRRDGQEQWKRFLEL